MLSDPDLIERRDSEGGGGNSCTERIGVRLFGVGHADADAAEENGKQALSGGIVAEEKEVERDNGRCDEDFGKLVEAHSVEGEGEIAEHN